MKLLADENLPRRLPGELSDLFPKSIHVSFAGLKSAPDSVIWEFAKSGGFTVLSKDNDFADLSIVRGSPPKVILLQIGNCSAVDVIQLVRNNAVRLSDFENDPKRSLLILH